MLVLSYYFLVSYIWLWNYVPQNKSKLIRKIAVMMLTSTVLYLIYAYTNAIILQGKSPLPHTVSYFFGAESSKALMPILVVSFVSYFTLVGRIDKGKNKLFSVSHIILTLISFFLGVYLDSLKVNIEPFSKTGSSGSSEKTNNYDSNEKVATPNTKELRVKEMMDSIYATEGAIKIVEMYVDVLRKKVPMKVDDGLLQYEEKRILFYNVSFSKAEKVVTYYYKYSTARDVDFSDETVKLLITEKRKKEEELIRAGNRTDRYSCFSEAEITFKVIYLDKDDNEIFRFMINKEDYI